MRNILLPIGLSLFAIPSFADSRLPQGTYACDVQLTQLADVRAGSSRWFLTFSGELSGQSMVILENASRTLPAFLQVSRRDEANSLGTGDMTDGVLFYQIQWPTSRPGTTLAFYVKYPVKGNTIDLYYGVISNKRGQKLNLKDVTCTLQ